MIWPKVKPGVELLLVRMIDTFNDLYIWAANDNDETGDDIHIGVLYDEIWHTQILEEHKGLILTEIMALTWDCVDWKNKSISVKGSISRVKDPDTGISALRYSEPKTKSGRRQVPILPNMIPVLLAHKEQLDAEKSVAGSAWNTQNLVFCSNVGTVIEPRRVCTTMNEITDAAELPRFTFHALRHTFATRMLEANVPAKVVQDVLGHADVTLTLITYFLIPYPLKNGS